METNLGKRQRTLSIEINLGKLPFDLDFHPSTPLVAAGLITGDLHLYSYAADSDPQRLLDIHAHGESCRAVRFIDSGRAILTASPDCSILATDVETGAAIARLDDAHGAAVNRLICLTETTVSSGDDDGCIKESPYHSSSPYFNLGIVFIDAYCFSCTCPLFSKRYGTLDNVLVAILSMPMKNISRTWYLLLILCNSWHQGYVLDKGAGGECFTFTHMLSIGMGSMVPGIMTGMWMFGDASFILKKDMRC